MPGRSTAAEWRIWLNWGCFRPKATKAPFIAGVFGQKSAEFCRDRSCAPQTVRFDRPKVPAWRPRRGGRVLPGQCPLRCRAREQSWAFGLLLVGAPVPARSGPDRPPHHAKPRIPAILFPFASIRTGASCRPLRFYVGSDPGRPIQTYFHTAEIFQRTL